MTGDDSTVILRDGPYAGRPITRVPISYLQRLAEGESSVSRAAKQELKRRGTTVPKVDVTNHAVDRASLTCLHIWRRDRRPREGFHSWLTRVAIEALATSATDKGRRLHKGLCFVFKFDSGWPVVVTIVKHQGSRRVAFANQGRERDG